MSPIVPFPEPHFSAAASNPQPSGTSAQPITPQQVNWAIEPADRRLPQLGAEQTTSLPRPDASGATPSASVPDSPQLQPAADAGAVAADDSGVDLREQLVNEGKIGPISHVSLPMEMITRLRGIMFDVDPKQFCDEIADEALRSNPAVFYEQIIRPMSMRNHVLAKAQVRLSGSGLHVLLLLHSPIVFHNEEERAHWARVIKVVQRLLPSDPDAPGITAMTRPVGSTNRKNGATVSILAPGEPVSAAEVLDLYEATKQAPVKKIMQVLLGSERVSPCPICGGKDSALAGLDRIATCYGSCGKVKLSRIYDVFLAPRPTRKGA